MNEEEKIEEVKEEVVETPVEQEQPVVEEPKTEEVASVPTGNNKKGGNKVIIIIMGIIIVALLAVILVLLLSGNDKSKNNENKQENIENKENTENTENTNDNNNITEIENTEVNNDNNDVEKDITSPEIINNLTNKFDKLFGDYINVLGENDKQNLFGRVLEWRVKFTEMENPPKDNDYAYYVGQLSLNAVDQEYYNLFGEKIDTSIEYQGVCSKAFYDKNSNLFIIKKYGCDAGWGWNVEGYRYKYTEDKNNAYIYVATAVHSGIESVRILSDNDTEKVYKTNDGSSKQFKLDESNYESFAKYKVTFKKDGQNYYYVGVQKIEEGK